MAVAISTNSDGTLEPWGPDECRQFVAEQEAEWRKGGKLTRRDVREIQGMLGIGMSHRKIASIYGVTHSAIGDIARGHREDREA